MLEQLIFQHWFSLHSAVAVVGLLIYGVTSHARKQRRHPAAALTWVVSLAVLPYLALPMYLLLGGRKSLGAPAAAKRTEALRMGMACTTLAEQFRQLSAAMGLPPAATYQGLTIHEDGREALDALRKLMCQASCTLDVSTFLLGRDVLGAELSTILIQRAQAGVKVRLQIDGVGVYIGGVPALGPLRRAGVKVELFVSPLRSVLPGRTNLRSHRKMAIADGHTVWMGGRNLAAEYFVGDPARHPPKTPWVDLTFVFSGALAAQVQAQFEQDWQFSKTGLPSAVRTQLLAQTDQDPVAQFLPSGPDQADDTLYSLLISSCFGAQRRITIVTPYFVPDATLLMALTLAARRGVVVDVVLPTKSNHRLADMARHTSLRDMAAAGAAIWLCTAMVHAKAVLIDEDLVLVGSANLDERSLFLNYEMMVAFFAPGDVKRFSEWVDRRRAGAKRYVARQPGIAHAFVEGVVRWLAFQL
jgi:cardiolipin synthase